MTFSSYVSVIRIILIIPIIILTNLQESFLNFLALFLFIFAALTDFLDGYIARKTNTETKIGAFLDLLADKLFVCIILIWLMILYKDPLFIMPATIMISRELIISSLRQYIVEFKKNIDVGVSLIGKSKTTFQFFSIGAFIISSEFGHWFYIFSITSIWLASVFSIFSLISYIKTWSKFSLDADS